MNLRYIAAIAVAALSITFMIHAEPAGLQWQTINYGLENAAKAEKLIVLDVYTDWCGWCKRMDRDTYADTSIIGYMNSRYIACKMNPEKKGSLTFDGKQYTLGEFGQALGIRGYPATVFFNEKGEVLTVLSGYMGPKDFINVLRYFGDGVYLTGVSYEDYRKKGSAAN